MGCKEFLRTWNQWNGLVVGVLTIVGFFIHFFNGTREGVQECLGSQESVSFKLENGGTQELGMADCIGPFLRWSTGMNAQSQAVSWVGDVNFYWRRTFTFKPQEFLDLWTPGFLGVLQVVQHMGFMRVEFISLAWWNQLLWSLVLAFWAQFGYAGNFGVFVGFYTTCAFCPALLISAFMDPPPTYINKDGDRKVDPNYCVLNIGDKLGCANESTRNKQGSAETHDA